MEEKVGTGALPRTPPHPHLLDVRGSVLRVDPQVGGKALVL